MQQACGPGSEQVAGHVRSGRIHRVTRQLDPAGPIPRGVQPRFADQESGQAVTFQRRETNGRIGRSQRIQARTRLGRLTPALRESREIGAQACLALGEQARSAIGMGIAERDDLGRGRHGSRENSASADLDCPVLADRHMVACPQPRHIGAAQDEDRNLDSVQFCGNGCPDRQDEVGRAQ